jgi:hypothetical protein
MGIVGTCKEPYYTNEIEGGNQSYSYSRWFRLNSGGPGFYVVHSGSGQGVLM